MAIDPQDADSTREILSQGQATPFWRVIQEAVDDSIAHLSKREDSEELRDLPAEQYKLESELLKAKRKYLQHLKELPKKIIEYLAEPPENRNTGNDDPYYSETELKKELLQDKA